jgi:hypothetical protein
MSLFLLADTIKSGRYLVDTLDPSYVPFTALVSLSLLG